MKTKLLILVLIIIVIAVVLAIIFLGGEVTPPTGTSTTYPYSSPTSEKPSSPMQVTLILLEVSLVLKFKSVTPAPNTEAKIELPDSFVLVSGDPTWNGDLKAGEEQNVEVVIKSTEIGYYQLKGSAISRQGESYFGNTAIIDIEIAPNDAIAGSKPENNWYPPTQEQALPMPENNQEIDSQLSISDNPQLNQEITITYRVTPSIDLPDPQRTQLSLVFPPKAFKILNVEFPQGGETYERDTQLNWKGSISKNQTLEIKATFRVINTGWGQVYGSLDVQPGSGITKHILEAKAVRLYVDKYGGNWEVYSIK